MSRYRPPVLLTNLLKAAFYLLYHQFAWSYDLVSAVVSLGRWQSWVNSVLPMIEGSNVLEIGHGPGHLQASLLAKGVFTVGIDESKQMSRLAGSRLKQYTQGLNREGIEQIYASPRLINGVGQHLPLSGCCFDTVVATFPAPYIFEKDALLEIQRVLKPEGLLLILLAAWFTGDNLADRSAAIIYRITGETPGPGYDLNRFISPFDNAGLSANIQWINLHNNRLLLIVARKQN